MMFYNYLMLFFHLSILVGNKIMKVLQKTYVIHYKYKDFIFTGMLINLIIKFILYLLFGLVFTGYYNIVILLLSIYICTMIDIHYIIHVILTFFIKFIIKYIRTSVAFEYWGYMAPEEEINLIQAPRKKNIYNENLNKERDIYYFFHYILLFFISVRYFIIREPYLFSAFHVIVIVNYLQDKYLSLLFIYLLIIQLSRFIFFLTNDYERWKFETWMRSWIFIWYELWTIRRTTIPKLQPIVTYSSKHIFKFTKNNIYLAMFYALRYQFSSLTEPSLDLTYKMNIEKIKLNLSQYTAARQFNLKRYNPNIFWFSRFSHKENLLLLAHTWFYELFYYKPNIFDDCQKFVIKNQCFWLALLLFTIYFDSSF